MDFASNALLNTQPDQPSFMKYMGISLGCHVVLFLLFIVGGLTGFHKKPAPIKFISVDLVSLPDTGDRPSRRTTIAGNRSKSKKSVYKKPEKIPTPLSGEKNKPEIKQSSLKKKAVNPEQTFDDTLKKLKQKVDNDRPESIAQALDRLNKQVADQNNKTVRVSEHSYTTNAESVSPHAGRVEAIDIYKIELKYHITSNWILPQQIVGKNNDLKTIIAIKIAANGKILDMWFDHRSGNDYYDESARKAVLKSAPLPHLPPGFSNYTVGFEFTPPTTN